MNRHDWSVMPMGASRQQGPAEQQRLNTFSPLQTCISRSAASPTDLPGLKPETGPFLFPVGHVGVEQHGE